MENQMTFDEIYARELKKIKQDPVSFVWNNCIKKHDDQEFMVITYPKECKYPKYFIECLYFLRFDISEIKNGSSTDAILLQNHNNAKFTDEQKDGIQKIIAYFGCRQLNPIKEKRIHIKGSKLLLDSMYAHSVITLMGMCCDQIYKHLFPEAQK